MTESEQPDFGSARLIAGDALAALGELRSDSVDLVVSSPPYNLRKIYERETKLSLEEYVRWQQKVIVALGDKVKNSGSVCWQVGNHVSDGEVVPLDTIFYKLFKDLGFKLRNRIVWRYNFGLNAERRFSGRYETILWFTKSDQYYFNVDPVRVPQIYPGKRHSKSKGSKAGTPSGNPQGKNPGDFWEYSAKQCFFNDPVWDVPNVKASHPEHTKHPCQFPIELVERCVLALSKPGEMLLDPFVGTGASAIAAVKHGRDAIGIDREASYIGIAQTRLERLMQGDLPLRQLGRSVRRPDPKEKVARLPTEWESERELLERVGDSGQESSCEEEKEAFA